VRRTTFLSSAFYPPTFQAHSDPNHNPHNRNLALKTQIRMTSDHINVISAWQAGSKGFISG
jgi:hypothetical protein